ncbi:acyltransferase family protein [Ornithinimicrobium sp. Y1694]|uniref:acyltransferase family protein n=1 Tax=Ornithinimicrobium sp. Y1694 TaxID=3418590 RepID=UPI003CEA79F8
MSTGHVAALRGDIEGLRAIAVLMVLLYHAGVPGVSGGFAGVDVFFVISGYLITGQLVQEARRSGQVSLLRFYARRARRLLPAAGLVLTVTTLVGWWLLPAGRRGELGTDVLGATFYVVNWVFAGREVDYLAEDSAPSLVQHYWSLSVEEQFYVLWPLLILVVLYAVRRWQLPLVPLLTLTLGTLVVASFVWSVVHTASSPGNAYFVTTTRIWQLGVGGLLVLLTPLLGRLHRAVAPWLAGLGLLLIAITLLAVSTSTPWPGSAALLPTLGTAAVIAAGIVRPVNPVAQLLGVGPMRFLGGLSYGLYLWHWPALRVLAELAPDAGLMSRLLVAGFSVLLAWLSLKLVENPIRFAPALTASHLRTLAVGAGTMALTAVLGATLMATAPRFDPTAGRGEVLEQGAVGEVGDEHEHDDAADGQDVGGTDGAGAGTNGDEAEGQDAGGTDEQGGAGTGGQSGAGTGDADEPAPIVDAGAIGLVRPDSRTATELERVSDVDAVAPSTTPIYPDPAVATRDIPPRTYAEGCQVAQDSVELVGPEECWFGDPDGDIELAVLGDSKMAQWMPALDPIARQEGWRVKVWTRSTCGFAAKESDELCREYNQTLSAHLTQNPPDILITSMVRAGGEALGGSMAELIRPIQDAGTTVVVLADNPAPTTAEMGDRPSYECVAANLDDLAECSYKPGRGSGTHALSIAAEQLDAPLLEMDPWICPPGTENGRCPIVIGRVLIFRQGSHLTATYVSSLTPILHHELVRLGIAQTPLEDIPWQIADPAG